MPLPGSTGGSGRPPCPGDKELCLPTRTSHDSHVHAPEHILAVRGAESADDGPQVHPGSQASPLDPEEAVARAMVLAFAAQEALRDVGGAS